jgi:hypothetical protein
LDSRASAAVARSNTINRFFIKNGNGDAATRPMSEVLKFDGYFDHTSYMILDRCTSNPVARPRPIPNTDRVELFYWSNVKDCWTTFGNTRRMKLMLESAHEIIENDPMFRIPRGR